MVLSSTNAFATINTILLVPVGSMGKKALGCAFLLNLLLKYYS